MSERTGRALPNGPDVEERVFDWDTWDAIMTNLGYPPGAKRDQAMRMNHSTLSRIKSGKSKPGAKFIDRTEALGIPYKAVFRTGARHGN